MKHQLNEIFKSAATFAAPSKAIAFTTETVTVSEYII